MNDKTLYWLEIAEYDLETARAMLETRRYVYVGFMCHQVVEKTLKAVIAGKDDEPPYIHNLSRLADLAGLYSQMSVEQKDTLDALEPLNIQARYPEDVGRLASTLNADRCEKMIEQTEVLHRWIRARL